MRMMSQLTDSLSRIVAATIIAMTRVYQYALSSVLPGTCRFEPTCSCYAIQALENHGLLHGSYLTAKRLLRCHPWGGWGYDPVPTHSDASVSLRKELENPS